MVSKLTEEQTNQQITVNERLLQQELSSMSTFEVRLNMEYVSQKHRQLLATRKIQIEIQVKRLQSEQELVKYSPYIKIDYCHNLSTTLGLIRRYKNFIDVIKKKEKYLRA